MKASYINLGKTATKALLIAGDISSFCFLALGMKVSYCEQALQEETSFWSFLPYHGVLTQRIIYH